MSSHDRNDSQHERFLVSRRRFLLAAGALAPALAAIRKDVSANTLFIAYHDASPAYHQKQFDDPNGPAKKGYRLESLSVYRSGNGTLYAAVWTNAPGPAWQAFHGLAANGYQNYFNNWTAQGYRPVIVTATGGGVVGTNQTNDAVFAGVFHKDSTPFVARHGIALNEFKDMCNWAKQNQHVLRWASIYGGKSRLYAAVWEKAAPGVAWDYNIKIAIDGPNEAGPSLTMPGNPSLRLSFVTRSPFAEYLAVYRSDQAGQRIERHGMTSGEYQNQFNALTAQSYLPVCVQAGGDPRVGAPRFVAIFQKQ